METKTKESDQADNMQTGNRTMTGRPREISRVFCVEENIERAELTVQLGAVCAERVAKRIASRQNAQQERKRTTSKSKMTNPVRKNSLLGAKVIQQMKFIVVHEENFEKVATATTTSATSKKAQTAQEIIEEYKDVFEGDLGTLEGLQHLNVDPSVPASIAPSRRVPFAIKPKLKAQLERLTDIGVLIPVVEPTDWVSNLVVATKESGVLRLCLDPQQLNKALKRERYPLPAIDDVLPDLSRAKVFTKINARNGYWHVQLDDQSSKLTTFNTPYGRYRWKRLPFGVSVASEIFSKEAKPDTGSARWSA